MAHTLGLFCNAKPQKVDSSCNDPTLYSEGGQFDSRLGRILTDTFYKNHIFPLPLWNIGQISQFLNHLQTLGLLGRVISSSQGLYLNIGQHIHRKTHTHQTSMP
jgi:hypothetical protein